jgi:hypothetical protein
MIDGAGRVAVSHDCRGIHNMEWRAANLGERSESNRVSPFVPV